MLELVFANLRTRPFRTLISIIGVAIGVILVVVFTGLATGMADDMIKRSANWKAEIVFTRPGAMDLSSSNMNVSTTYAERLLDIDGVKSAVPVGRYISMNPNESWGLQHLDGVEWAPFAEMNGMEILRGVPATGLQELVLDERHMKDKNYKLGDSIEVFGKDFKIVGVFAPPSGARIKMSLAAMQDALQVKRKCTYILVKLEDGADTKAIAAIINNKLPGNTVNLTEDLLVDVQDRLPSFNTFLNVLVGLGAFVSTIFVMLSMYTTITERRKEIGILKSLGASKSFVIKIIEGEAFMVGILGVILGLILSAIGAFVIENVFELAFKFSWGWVITAFFIAIGGSLVGALYPAWRASDIDPVLVLVNE